MDSPPREAQREQPAWLEWLATSPIAIGVALLVFMVLGYFFKNTTMTWIKGPLFPVTVLYVIPRLAYSAYRRLAGGAAR